MKKLEKENIEDILMLTPMQEGMLFHYLKEPESDLYYEHLSLNISGEINVQKFEAAWNFVIDTNELLRTVFRWEKLEKPVQIILKEHKIQLKYHDFSNKNPDEKQKWLEKTKVKDRKEKFDLKEVPFRMILCKVEPDNHEMIISNHHILYDGWSNGIILEEFFKAYNGLSAGKELLRPVKTRFREFVKWNQDRDLDGQEKFWRDYLKRFDTPTELTIKRRRGKEIFITGSFGTSLSREITGKIEGFVKNHKITLAAFLYSAWGILLQKYCNSDDVIFGTTVSGRAAPIKGIEDMVGLFINTIPLRIKTNNGESIENLLREINDLLPLVENKGSTSLAEIKGYSELENNQELFDSLIVLENYPLDHGLSTGNHFSSLRVNSYSIVENTNYDLTIGVLLDDDIEINYYFNKLLFEKASIERLSQHFINIIEKILSDFSRRVSDIELLSEVEKHMILFDLNNTAVKYPKDKTIHRLFEEQTRKSPNNISLIFADQELTYRELNQRANHLAHMLQSKGVQPQGILGLMVKRSPQLIMGILAILKSGGVYLPIDPDFPKERIEFVLADSATTILVTMQDLSNKITFEKEIIYLSDMTNRVLPPPYLHQSPLVNVPASSLAYIIYTSGSTGRPKGVLISHRSLVNYTLWAEKTFVKNEKVNFPLYTSISFDLTITSIFTPLISGQTIIIFEEKENEKSFLIEEVIRHPNIGVVKLTPSHLKLIREKKISPFNPIKRFIVGGEELETRLARDITGNFPGNIEIYNEYGPTESTVGCMIYRYNPRDNKGKSVPIGVPADNTKIFILDSHYHPIPVGVAGELCISGDGLAMGYLNLPELTAEKFIKFEVEEGSKYTNKKVSDKRIYSHMSYIYKSGDLARLLGDGNIEFLGRIDHQVKIRGFRIELGEIENQLFNYDHIKEAVVTTNEDKNGDKYLCAYIVPHSPDHIEISRLQNHLAQKLPDYMIPTYFVQLEQIPLTPTGKVDRKALPTPEIKSEIQYTAPRNKIEEQLVEIWSEVLGIQREKIGIDHNFFRLGGHSLKAARLLARIHKKLDVEIPLAKMFETPTVRGLFLFILELRKTPLSAIESVEEKECYELSTSQKRFYVFWQWRPKDFSYNVSEIMIMEGLLSREKFTRVFQQLINRHESLRTSFHLVEGEPVRRIHDKVEFEIEYYKVEEEEGTKGLAPLPLIKNFIRSFDLSRAPLVRLGFARIQGEKHFLMFDMHHIVSDGVSIGIFIKEFLALHAGEQLLPLRIQYKDYVEWEKKKKKKRKTPPHAKYQETTLNLPLDFPRPAVQDFKGNTIKFEIDGLERAADLLSLEEDITLFMVLLAAFNVFLSKITGQENIVVGSPIAGRQHPDLEGIIGLFINPLVLQNFPEAHQRFSDFLMKVKKSALEAFENQYDQYDEIMETVTSSRNTSHNPLYDVMFVLQNMEMPDLEIPGLKVIRQVGGNSTAKFDMTLYYEEFFSSFKLEYSTALFKLETIQRFIGYFKKVMEQILENRHQAIAEIEIISREEKQQILYDFNDTVVEYPYDKCIYQLITNQVQETPDRLAVIQFPPDESCGLPVNLTYRELNAKSNQLARLLRKRGIKANTVVGIMMKRSLEMLLGILGILKAGGAYLPVDSQYPENRIANMLENSHTSFLLTTRAILEEKSRPFLARHQEVGIILTDEWAEEWEKEPGKNLKPFSSPNDLIYIIFTSGSTGIPKGAGVYHRGFVNLMHWFVTEFDFNHHDRNLLLTSLSFDLTQKNFYASLITGGQFCIPGFSYFEPRSLVKLIQEYRVTWINCTPSMFYKLVEYKTMNEDKRLSSLRYVFLGGEPISISTLIDWWESEDCHAEIVNTYGPTECTDISNFYRIKEPRRFLEEAVPIGQPVYNVQLYVPDKNLQLQPVGIAGELYIGGAGVGIGYINDEQLTSQKFIKHSFEPNQPGQLLYRTGDLVKWLPDGYIEFLGRIDHQVKIRGFRIELGEIENQLLLHPSVKETLVTARDDEAGEKYLCAYIVPHSTQSAPLNTAELREYLSRELPDYMVPAYFMVLEKMPLNPNGKVDRKALPEPDLTSKDNYVPPQNDTEKRLAEIWAEVLGLDIKQVGIHDNFFLSGGHSLKAAALISRIHKAFSVEIPIAEIFKQPTIKNISRYIEQNKESLYSSIAPVEKREYYPLSSAQKRLFIIEQMDPGKVTYNIPEVLKLEGKLDKSCFAESFTQLIARHESLRTSFQLIAGEPVQRVHDSVGFEIEHYKVDVEIKVEEERSSRLEGTRGLAPLSIEPATRNPQPVTALISSFIRPFDLSKAPLLRVGLIEFPHTLSALRGYPRRGTHASQEGKKQQYILMFDMHHIISDGISMQIFIKEFTAFYRGEVIPGLRIQYKDFSHWQNALMDPEEIKPQESYWSECFAGEIPVLTLPYDFPRPALQTHEGSSLEFLITLEQTRQLKQLALESETTTFIVLLTVFNLLLSKLSGQEDIVVGSPTTGRRYPDLETLLGVFINTLALRNYPAADRPYHEFLAEVKRNSLEAYENQDYQYEELVEKLDPQRDLSRNPLFDVMLVVPNLEMEIVDIPGLELKPFKYPHRTSKFDMTVTALEKDHLLDFTLTYSTALFTEETIRRFINYFKRVLDAVLKNTGQKIAEIDILGDDEKQQLLFGFNPTEQSYSRDKTIHWLFEEQAAQTPDHIVLVGKEEGWKGRRVEGKKEEGQLSYRELNERANQLARLLRREGVKRETITGIMMGPSPGMIIGLLAVLKAGGVYLPIDPHQQAGRVIYMLKDSQALLLLIQEHVPHTPAFGVPFLSIDRADLYKGEGSNLDRKSRPEDAVYTIYTSGTTGKSKGTLIENKNLVNYVNWFREKVHLTGKDRSVLTSSFSFDLGYTTIYPPILSGCQLHIIPGETYLSPGNLIGYINQHGITYIKVTPSLFTTIVESSKFSQTACRMLRLVVLGGEEIKLKDVGKAHRIAGHLHFMNHYGPTEVTIGCVARFIDFNHFDDYKKRPTIGAPIDNMKAFILDNGLMMVPVGVTGELCVSGANVARGYLNQPELTAQKFLHFSPAFYTSYRSYMSYIYKTGDMARWTSWGAVEFLGRIDTQVKIRGYRIELAEIENRLLTHDAINEAVVIPREHPSADKYLCAYIVLKNPGSINVPALKEHLAVELPDYMIPTFFVELDRIPLTPNGKLNRKLLPEPEMGALTAYYAAPGDLVEKKLAEVWQEVLEVDRIGIDDHFFQLGGHSLKAIILISRMNKAFHVNVPLAEIFKTPTIRGLSAYIKSKKQGLFTPIEPVEEKEYYALSSAQKRLYILHQMDEGSTSYNMPYVLQLEGEVDKNKLEVIFQRSIARHESLRTSFRMLDGAPVQRVHDDVEFKIEYDDISEVEVKVKVEVEEERSSRLEGTRGLAPLFIKEFIRPFDLSQAPLFRVGLIKLQHTPTALQDYPRRGIYNSQEGKRDKYLMIVDMHHIISDGISRRVLVSEFMALAAGKDLPPLRLQYKDFSGWQNSETQREAQIKRKDYWKTQLGGEIPVLDLPVDYARPTIQRFEGSTVGFELDQEEKSALQSLALAEGMTLYMILLAIYYILLSKLSNQEDILVGTPTAGRRHADLQQMIGLFINTLVLRNYPAGDKTYRRFLKEIRKRSLQDFENQDYSYEELVEEVAVTRDASRNPLFDTMFMMQNMGMPRIEVPGLKLTPVEHQIGTSKFDLTLMGTEKEERLLLTFEYSTNLFKKATIERLVAYLKKIVSFVVTNPDEKICDVEILGEEEKRVIIYDFNDTIAEYPRNKVIHELFAEQAAKNPDSIAVIGPLLSTRHTAPSYRRPTGDIWHCAFSYKKLNKRSNQLAYFLKEKGVGPDTIVGIIAERSIEMIVGIMGILKAGGTYLPIDPGFPEERIAYMLKDSNAKLLVTTPGFPGKFKKLSIVNCQLLMVNEEPHGNPGFNIPPKEANSIYNLQLERTYLAYVIYTSGSTGKPKGVMIHHQAVHNFIIGMTQRIDFTPGKVILALTTISFDIFVLETLLPLLQGLRIVIADERQQLDINLLEELIVKSGVDMLQATPTRMQMLITHGRSTSCLNNLKEIMVGGEPFPGKLLGDLKQLTSARIYNMYGPTETTVWSTMKDLTLSAIEEINIGQPIANTQIYILNKNNRPQPLGVIGDLYIGGDGLARGYINRPELTAEKFDQDLWDYRDKREKGEKVPSEGIYMSHMSHMSYIYRTGDLARWLPNGDVEFFGRVDSQVKIRGFRIELGEIENQLLNHNDIKEAVVVASEDGNGDKYLCAYIVGSKVFTQMAKNSELREYLSNTLPDYMIPSFFILLDKIPLTHSGKVDTRALPEPEITGYGSEFAAPRDVVEEKLVKIWSDVLSVNESRIGIDDNFFNLGGHSLRATILISKIHKAFNVKVPLTEIFKKPTIRKLSQCIEAGEKDQYVSIEKVEEKEYYPLSSAQKRLYLLHQINLEGTAYNMPVSFILEGVLEKAKLEDTFKKLIHRHESLRTSFHVIVDEPVQKMHKEVEFEIEYHDISEVEVEEEEGTIEPETGNSQPAAALISSFIRSFDLSQAPLLRVGLIPLEEEKHILMVDMHHIIADGLSMNILVREFGALYSGEEFPELILQYKDFSEWQNNRIKSGEIKKHEEFWLELFKGEIPLLNLPIDFKRPDVLSFEGSTVVLETDKEVTAGVIDIVSELHVTLNILLLAACYVLLSKYTGQGDIIIGIPIAGRTHIDLENIIGFFSNMLAMRNRPLEDKTFSQFVREIKENSVRAYENQEYQFEELVSRLEIQRESGRHPLVDTVFVLHNTGEQYGENTREVLGDLKIKPFKMERKVSHFDLLIHTYYANDVITLAIEYSNTLFKRSTIERMGKRYIDILKQVVENRELKLKEIKSPHELLDAKANIINDIQEDWGIDKEVIRVED